MTPPPTQDVWTPLESNPEVWNKYSRQLGLVDDTFEWTDIFSTDDWALDMVPGVCHAVVFLYPSGSDESTVGSSTPPGPDQPWFVHQRVSNACGTVALLHALCNFSCNNFQSDSWLSRLMASKDRSTFVATDAELRKVHHQYASSGATVAPVGNDAAVDTHFICFVAHNNCCYELNGRNPGPINHGPIKNDFLRDVCQGILAARMQAATGNDVRFALMAWVQKK